jgi:hypothetical protein
MHHEAPTIAMRRILIVALGISLALAVSSAYLVSLSRHSQYENGPRLKGPLRLSVLSTSGRDDQATQLQLEARALLISLSPAIHDPGVNKDKMVRVANAGRSVVTFDGYNSASPWYRIEVKRHGQWSLMPVVYTATGATPQLKPGESLEFPVILPEGNEPWRVGLVYDEIDRTNRVARLDNFVLRLLHRPPLPESTQFMVLSDEIPR